MPRYTTAVPSTMSNDEAFAYIARFEHLPEWDPSCIEATTTSPAPTLGVRYEVTVRFGKGIQHLTYEIVEFESPRRVVFAADTSRYRAIDTITVAPADAGSLVTYDAVINLKGLRKLAGPLIAGKFAALGEAATLGMRRVLNPAGETEEA
jgi:Polyketide cyclase / dehydrase and lipid transport